MIANELLLPIPANADPDEDLDMPLVPPRQHSTTFLYESFEDADTDNNFLAMGFFVGVPSDIHKRYFYPYLVTNEHAVRDFTKIFARIHLCTGDEARRRGRFREPNDLAALVIPATRFVTSVENDLAIARVSFPDDSLVHYAPVDSLIRDFRSTDSPDAPFVGVGDEILMMSRIVRRGVHYLKENIQVARFGNVAVVPKHEEPFFLAEMRSIAGHSGSPVWVHLSDDGGWNICGTRSRQKSFGLMLLGINRGHLRDYETIVTVDARGKETPHNRWVAQTNMAISQVVPAWLIVDLLNSKELKEQRDAADAGFHNKGGDIVEDSLKPVSIQVSEDDD